MNRAVALRRFHGIATLVWAGLAIPSLLWWHNSISWIVLMSVYACMVGHFGSWQASRAEVAEKHNESARCDESGSEAGPE